ncbi:YciI family protein [Virgibacillus sp. C22-A2]|uniref:YciI family protein n=1 Tax=Virgibacillus tibetensis TaxID=3042313 RepID=A0ABU6KCN8_9BACI|nr:YciI family protein [Virgibacillus sp. C22-A2]
MKYFAVFLPMLNEEKSKQYRGDHIAYLEEMDKKGKVYAKGRFTDGAGGLVIYIAETFPEVEELVKQDPYVKIGAREYEIHEWDMKVTEN